MTSSSILLVNPRVCTPSSTRLPLALMNLAAVLEGRHAWRLVDGNREADPVAVALQALRERPYALVGVSTMPGAQVAAAIEISAAIREAFPAIPIVWGGYFPTLYPDSAIRAPYVDYLIRGQGELSLLDLLDRLPDAGPPSLLDSAADPSAVEGVAGITWKRGGVPVHNPDRSGASPDAFPLLPYERLGDLGGYLRPSFMGERTAVYQAALGCRYRCTFCGVATMWNGKTRLEAPDRLLHSLGMLRDRWGADCVQFYDNNFFDGEDTSIPVLEALGSLGLPYWCFARTDTMARFSASTWEKVRKSRLRMAFFGAEAASNEILNRMKKGARVEHTIEVAARCREYGVIPEFSFILGTPDDADDQIEKTFEFIRRIKIINPDSEIVLQLYNPTPQRDRKRIRREPAGVHLPLLDSRTTQSQDLPATPEEWAEPQWVDWVSHQGAPWLKPRTRKRVRDFARVLACRFPTVQDYRARPWSKAVLRSMARWRYATRYYDHSWELAVANRIVRLRDPRRESL